MLLNLRLQIEPWYEGIVSYVHQTALNMEWFVKNNINRVKQISTLNTGVCMHFIMGIFGKT